MMGNTRSTNTTESSEEEDKRGRHAKTGFPYWKRVAPDTASLADVLEAYEKYDSPEEAWNHSLTDFEGESR